MPVLKNRPFWKFKRVGVYLLLAHKRPRSGLDPLGTRDFFGVSIGLIGVLLHSLAFGARPRSVHAWHHRPEARVMTRCEHHGPAARGLRRRPERQRGVQTWQAWVRLLPRQDAMFTTLYGASAALPPFLQTPQQPMWDAPRARRHADTCWPVGEAAR